MVYQEFHKKSDLPAYVPGRLSSTFFYPGGQAKTKTKSQQQRSDNESLGITEGYFKIRGGRRRCINKSRNAAILSFIPFLRVPFAGRMTAMKGFKKPGVKSVR